MNYKLFGTTSSLNINIRHKTPSIPSIFKKKGLKPNSWAQVSATFLFLDWCKKEEIGMVHVSDIILKSTILQLTLLVILHKRSLEYNYCEIKENSLNLLTKIGNKQKKGWEREYKCF